VVVSMYEQVRIMAIFGLLQFSVNSWITRNESLHFNANTGAWYLGYKLIFLFTCNHFNDQTSYPLTKIYYSELVWCADD